MRVAVALGALVSVWCLGKHGRQDTVGGVGVEAAPVGWKSVPGFEWLTKEVHGQNASGTQDDRYGLRWVCTYGTSHPGRWSALESIDRYVTFGYTVLQQKYPGRVERN